MTLGGSVVETIMDTFSGRSKLRMDSVLTGVTCARAQKKETELPLSLFWISPCSGAYFFSSAAGAAAGAAGAA